MIFDTLENCSLYYEVNSGFEKAFEFLKNSGNLPVGKYEIDGSNVYAMVQEYTTKPEHDCSFEGHRKYIDIQYMVSGTEAMDVTDASKVVSKTAYDEARDLEFFENCDTAVKGVVQSGEYAIFFPHDIHKPSMAFNGKQEQVKKIVVKVAER
ncbi:MAG: YhcH/YjgK/YiaL family protein [Clostridia bacterium]|nr:YhcH/YjgK/YiaL family protein [Clostridia bacterium]